MKYIIGREPKVEEAKEKTLEMWLSLDDKNSVSLMGKDENGSVWYILHFGPSGKIHRLKGVGTESGLSLDRSGRIELEGE